MMDQDELTRDLTGRFAEMIRCRTVSYKDTSLEDPAEFKRFRELLFSMYPGVSAVCAREEIGRTGLLYRWKGRGDGRPLVLMAHYDVVPADASQWEKEPFAAEIDNGIVWGRGTLDTKGTLCGIMEAAEKLISEGFVPENDVYFSFSGEEETDGSSTPEIVSYLKEIGVRPAMVLDEGGAVVSGVVPGVRGKCALVGTGEKGKMHLRLSVKSKGGHASSPPPSSPVGRLARCVVAAEKKPFKFHVSGPVRQMFGIMGRNASPGLGLVYRNLRIFSPLLDLMTRKTGGEMNALFRTTVAFTGMKGSDAVNVFPPRASVDADVRLMEGDTGESVVADIKRKIAGADMDVEVECLNLIPVRPFSDIGGQEWTWLKDCIEGVWGDDVIVSPYLMIACSDSRHYTDICDNIYKFSAMELSADERRMIHGHNERIPVEKLLTTVKFYEALMRVKFMGK